MIRIPTDRFRRTVELFTILLLVSAGQIAADLSVDLDSLHAQDTWGEFTFQNGHLRHAKVDSVSGQQIIVREVVGPLQIRPAKYALSDVRSVRNLGPQRFQPRMSPIRRVPSMPMALGLELLIPGAGYYYAGDNRQGWRVLLASAVIGGVAFSMGENGAAAWLPLGTWLKLYSLKHLADEVGANRAIHERRSQLLSARPSIRPSLGFQWQF